MAAWVFVKNVKLIPADRMAFSHSLRYLQLSLKGKHVHVDLKPFQGWVKKDARQAGEMLTQRHEGAV